MDKIMTATKAIYTLQHESCYECAYGCEQGADSCEAGHCVVKDATKMAIDALEQWIDRKKVGLHGDLIERDEIVSKVQEILNMDIDFTADYAIYEIMSIIENAEIKLRGNRTQCIN